MGATLSPRSAQVIDLETARQRYEAKKSLVRLSPELDGLEMVYQLDNDPERFYSMPVLAWGLRDDGLVVGLIPWMEKLTPCHLINSGEYGCFVGYRDPETEEIFPDPPEHKWHELTASAEYFDYESSRELTIIQQLPDHQGTYALCMESQHQPWQLKQVYGWNLYNDGSIDALVADDSKATMTPILLKDACLYSTRTRHPKVYFFQRHIANKIMQEDPETLENLALMVLSPAH